MAYIYKITNLINGKIYIGETIRDIQTRFREHKSVAFNEKGHGYNYHLHNAMRKYGVLNFSIEQLEFCKDEIRFEKETFYIKKYNSIDRNYGYNCVIEGNGATLISTEDILYWWNKGLSVLEISEQLGCHRGTISKRLHSNGITHSEIIKRFGNYVSKRDSKQVLQYQLDGTYIKEYFNANQAGNENGLNPDCIKNVCLQKQKQTGNYLWKYKEDNRDILEWVNINSSRKEAGKPKKKIIQYSLDGNRLQVFESAAAAASFIGLVDKSCICRAARLKGKSHGYIWEYLEK